MDHSQLRPIERVIVKLTEAGHPTTEISRRVGKKPGTVVRILQMVEMKDGQGGAGAAADPHALRPLERVIAKLRARGESYGEIGNRLARSGAQIRRIEDMARMKLEA
jgi:DNA-binding CsgD family transcriptional regulator